ncbi:hypothetical protein D3C72_2580190 [compost metagenome]
MYAADAFDQGRLAGTIVAQQCQHFAAPGFQADIVEGQHRPEALAGIADAEDDVVVHCSLAARRVRTRPSR